MTKVLPERCHVVLPGLPKGGNVVICVRGALGVRVTTINLGDYENAKKVISELNRSLGIGEATERVMLLGCLFGWEGAGSVEGAPAAAEATVVEQRPEGVTLH